MTAEQKQQIENLRKQGVSYKNIAMQMQISVNTIKTHCIRHGLGDQDYQLKKRIASKRKGTTIGRIRHYNPCPVLGEISISYAEKDDEFAFADVMQSLMNIQAG